MKIEIESNIDFATPIFRTGSASLMYEKNRIISMTIFFNDYIRTHRYRQEVATLTMSTEWTRKAIAEPFYWIATFADCEVYWIKNYVKP